MNDRDRALAVYESLRNLEAPGAKYGAQLAAVSLGSIASQEQTTPWEMAGFLVVVAGLLALRFRRPAFVGQALRDGLYGESSASDGDAETDATPDTSASSGPDASPEPAPVQARHLGGDTSTGEPWTTQRVAPQVDAPESIADAEGLGDVVAVESADGTAVWARLFTGDGEPDDEHRGPRMLVIRDGGSVEIARAGGAIGVVVGETSREPLPLPAPADVQWAGNGETTRCHTWGDLQSTLRRMTAAVVADDASDLPVDTVTTRVADFLARTSVGHVDVRTDGEEPLSAHFVDRDRSAHTGTDAVPVLLWHRSSPRGPYRGAAWPVIRPRSTQVFFGEFDTGVNCAGPQDLIELFARTLSVVSPERLALRVLDRADSVGPTGHVLVSGPGCRPMPDRWMLSTVESPSSPLPRTGNRVPVVVRSQQFDADLMLQ